MQPLHMQRYSRTFSQRITCFLVALILLFPTVSVQAANSMVGSQALHSSVLNSSRELSQTDLSQNVLSQSDIVVQNANGPGSLHQALMDAEPGDTIRFAPALSDQVRASASIERSVELTSTSQISAINITIVVNPERIDELSGLIPGGEISEAAVLDLLLNGEILESISSTVPIFVVLEGLEQSVQDLLNGTTPLPPLPNIVLDDIADSAVVLTTDIACSLLIQALEGQGLDAFTLSLLSDAVCALVGDGISSGADLITAEVEAVLNTIGQLDENTLLNFGNTICDLIGQGIAAGDVDPLIADLLADIACQIVTENITALNDQIVSVVEGGVDEALLQDLAGTVSNLLLAQLTAVIPGLDGVSSIDDLVALLPNINDQLALLTSLGSGLGLQADDLLQLLGDITGVDINVSLTVAAPGELGSDVLASVIVTIGMADDDNNDAFATCGGFAIIDDGAGNLTAPDYITGTLIVGTNGPDVLYGTNGNELILGLEGPDDIFAGGGDDIVCGGRGLDIIYGENGNDILYGDQQSDWLIGGNQNDILYGGNGNDDLEGNKGEDTIYGERGSDVLLGGNQSDNLYGGDGPDYLDGANGNDVLDGGAGIDTIYGGNGNDTLMGDSGNDELFGNKGNDDLNGGAGSDYCLPGNGNDTVAECESPANRQSTLEDVPAASQAYTINDQREEDAIRNQMQHLYLPMIAQ
ncbi:MAG: calcium-binding protein [Chloroflexota bacterium]